MGAKQVQMASFNVNNVAYDNKRRLFPTSYAKLIAKFADVVDNCKFASFPIKVDKLVIPDRILFDFVQLKLMAVVKDRDSGHSVDIMQTRNIPIDVVKEYSKQDLAEIVYDEMRNLVLHELAESFTFRNNRIYDPHKVGVLIKMDTKYGKTTL